MKTPIIYYGGKYAILKHLLPLIPPHKIYTEVFFGGGALFWAKNPVKNEIINDNLDIVINFYTVLKENFPKLKKLIDKTLYSRTHYDQTLLLIRKHKKGEKVDPIQLAWAFWMGTNMAYLKTLGSGIIYSPHKDVAGMLRNKKQLITEKLKERIEHVFIENKDAIEILECRNYEDALHFIDPPYVNTNLGHYNGFSLKDNEALLKWCAKCKGKFMLTNYHSDKLAHHIKKNNWHVKEIKRKSAIHQKKQKKSAELIVTNYNPNS